MTKTIAILSTLDTKAEEAAYLKERIEAHGGRALLVDIGLVGQPGVAADVDRAAVVAAGGGDLAELLQDPSRQAAAPFVTTGATKLLLEAVEAGRIDGVLAMGGTQGSSTCGVILQALPYGLPKVLVSTVASGDTAPFIGIKDIAMVPSVGDLLGLNPFTRRILANAAGAVWGMAEAADAPIAPRGDRPVIGMTNLGVLTEGAMRAVQRFQDKGYEVIVFHAVGSGGLAMEQMMKEGIIGAVFDYAMGEIADEVFGGLRAASPERLTVAGGLGLPQVIVPGGCEHLGLLVEPNVVPDEWKDHKLVFHTPIVFVPRLDEERWCRVGQTIADRLAASTTGRCTMMLPLDGTSRYCIEGGELRDPELDAAFFAYLKDALPDTVDCREHPGHAEDPAFVDACVDRLIELIEG